MGLQDTDSSCYSPPTPQENTKDRRFAGWQEGAQCLDPSSVEMMFSLSVFATPTR